MSDSKSARARRAFVIANPASSNGKTGRRWPELAGALGTHLGSFDHALTGGPNDAVELTRNALSSGHDFIVSVGGDGTHNEVVNGFFDAGQPVRADAALGIVPMGTGGDLKRTLDVSPDPLMAIAMLGQRFERIDLGRMECVGADGQSVSRLFINVASFGMGGLVVQLVNDSSKALGGKASFLLGVAKAATRYRCPSVCLIVDDGEPWVRSINNVAVANGQFFGGGMHIAPRARMNDGRLDVIVINDLGTLRMARGLRKLYRGEHLSMAGVESLSGQRVVAEPNDADTKVLIDLDGEQPGHLPATFTLLPRAITVSVGASFPTDDHPELTLD